MTAGKINITETLKSVEDTLRSDTTISPQVRTLMELLVVVINLLVGKLGLNSKNSSTPPSRDPNRRRSSKQKGKAKPGGQNGHEGITLRKVDTPDHVKVIPVDRRTLPVGKYKPVGFKSRQVVEIKVSAEVTEYRAEILEDENGKQFVADFPDGVTRPIQYGASVKTQAAYMSLQQLIPYDRIREYFADQCGLPISAGSVFNFNSEAYHRLEAFEAIAKRELIAQKILNVDETGININGKRLWLHTAGNDKWTLFFPHEKRGREAMDAMGVLEYFRGTLCHDHWKAYFTFDCQHALCNAHHLRELEWAWEHEKQKWAKKMQNLLLDIKATVDKTDGSLTPLAEKKYRQRYRSLLVKADRECPPPKANGGKRGRIARSKSRNLLERLRDFETETLRFMTDKAVPFTNNQGENDIRMTKVQQKISGCFRSMEGAQIFCRVRSYLSTCRKHGIAPTEALQTLFSGRLPDFLAKLE